MIHNPRNGLRGQGQGHGHGQDRTAPSLQTCGRANVIPPHPSTLFDYARFASFQELLDVLERRDRFWKIRHGKPVLQLKDYTSEVLTQEFQDKYGEMDTTSPKFALLFNTYKEERLSIIEEWVTEEEEYKNNLILKGFKIVDPDFEFPLEEHIDAQEEFSPHELAAFCKVSQGVKLRVERFILPRTELTTVDEIRNLSTPINLALFDPQMSLPSDAIPPCPYPDKENYPLPKLLQRIQSQMHEHVTGITPPALFDEFDEQNGYKIDFHNFDYPDFGWMVRDLSHIVWFQFQSADVQLCFPTFLQGLICTPRELFWNIFHHIRFILARAMLKKKVFTVRQAFAKCEQIFGFEIGPDKLSAWGYTSFEDFAHFLINYWPHHRIALKRENEVALLKLKFKRDPEPGLYILKETEEMKEKLLKSEKAAAAKLLPPMAMTPKNFGEVPFNCLGAGDDISWETDAFVKDEIYCVMTTYWSPLSFYVVLHRNWEKFVNLQSKLRNIYEQDWDNDLLKVNSALLIKGMYLVSYYYDEEIKDHDYYRVQYVGIEKFEGSDRKHKVLSIDYGFEIEVNESNLRYLLRDLAYEMYAQAIHCSLFNVDPPKNSTTFPLSVINRGFDLLECPKNEKGIVRPILVNFFREEKKENDKPEWKVKACGADRGKVPDVGKAVMDYMKKNCPEALRPPVQVPNASTKYGNIFTHVPKPLNESKNLIKQGPAWSSSSTSKFENTQTQPDPCSFLSSVETAMAKPQLTDAEVPPWMMDRLIQSCEPQPKKVTPKPPTVSSWANIASKPEPKNTTKTNPNPTPNSEDFPSLGLGSAVKSRRRN